MNERTLRKRMPISLPTLQSSRNPQTGANLPLCLHPLPHLLPHVGNFLVRRKLGLLRLQFSAVLARRRGVPLSSPRQCSTPMWLLCVTPQAPCVGTSAFLSQSHTSRLHLLPLMACSRDVCLRRLRKSRSRNIQDIRGGDGTRTLKSLR